MEAKQEYICASWQGLLQQLAWLLSRGYWYHHVTYLPERKRDRWERIDQKLIKKYGCDKTKWQRARLKKKGVANFYYLRWENVAVLMHTSGDIPSDIVYDDHFRNIMAKGKKNRLKVQISPLVGFEFYQDPKGITVKLDKQTYAGIKDHLETVVATKNVAKIVHEYNKLNGFPAFRGIVRQKIELAKFILNRAGHHQIRLSPQDLRIITYKPFVTVFEKKRA